MPGDFDDLKRERLIQERKHAEEAREREQALVRHHAAVRQYGPMVLSVLEDLRQAVDPGAVVYNGEYNKSSGYWALKFTKSNTDLRNAYISIVSVFLQEDNHGNPTGFRCVGNHYSYEAELSRNSLVYAIRHVI